MNRKKIIIIFIMITIVISAMLVYNSVFCYANTEAGRLQAVEDYISDSISSADFHVSAYKEAGKDLYTAFSSGNTYGILCLAHGINGKYRPIYASFEAFPYTQGVYYISTRDPCSCSIGRAVSVYTRRILYINTRTASPYFYGV